VVANRLKQEQNIVRRLTPKTLAASSAFRPSLVMAAMSGDHFIGGRELLRGLVP
jgi:hypothetical protein